MKGAHPARRLPFVTRRLLQVVPTVVGILLISFLLVHLAPGDPLLALAGEHGDAAYYADMRQRFGLDEPIPRQLLIYMQRVAVGDLGFSYVQGRSAAALILDRAPATLLLTGSAPSEGVARTACATWGSQLPRSVSVHRRLSSWVRRHCWWSRCDSG